MADPRFCGGGLADMAYVTASTRSSLLWLCLALFVAAAILVSPTLGHSVVRAPLERAGAKRLLVVSPAERLIRVANARPGTAVTRSATVRYRGKRPARLRFRVVRRGTKAFASRLRLVVEVSRRRAYSGSLQRAQRPRGVGRVAPGTRVRFRITVAFPRGRTPAIDNRYQGRRASIRFLWSAAPGG
jgi:hypothetical protein